jgi:outer membrane protein TolC
MRSISTLASAPEVKSGLVKPDRVLSDVDELVRHVNSKIDPLVASVDQAAIQQAFRDVEDALVFRAKASEIRTQQEARVQAARRALDIANLRYTNGLGTYLDVLDAQRQLFTAEIDLAGITRDQLTAVVQVYKALGGGWEVER